MNFLTSSGFPDAARPEEPLFSHTESTDPVLVLKFLKNSTEFGWWTKMSPSENLSFVTSVFVKYTAQIRIPITYNFIFVLKRAVNHFKSRRSFTEFQYFFMYLGWNDEELAAALQMSAWTLVPWSGADGLRLRVSVCDITERIHRDRLFSSYPVFVVSPVSVVFDVEDERRTNVCCHCSSISETPPDLWSMWLDVCWCCSGAARHQSCS